MISVKVLLIAFVYLRVANAFELKCEFEKYRDLYYCCDVQSLIIHEPNTMITSISGIHLNKLGINDVEFLKINEQYVKYLPINIAEYFPILKQIQVTKSKLKFLTKQDFLGLTQLQTIIMTDNKLQKLPCGVFETNKRLVELHFENNSLSLIGTDVLKPLPLLSKVHFRKNGCIDKEVNGREDLPALLDDITKNCFMRCQGSKVNEIQYL